MDIDVLFEQLPKAANSHSELVRIGRHCNVEFLLEAGEYTCHITVQAGRVIGVHRGPFRMRSWCFALRASEAAWREFWAPVPRPGFHDIFAMTSRGHARIEGDIGPLLLHLRYIKALLQLPRSMLAKAR